MSASCAMRHYNGFCRGGWGKLAQIHGTTLDGASFPITTAQLPPGRCRSKQASPRLSPRCRRTGHTTRPGPQCLMPGICPPRCPKLCPQGANPRSSCLPSTVFHLSPYCTTASKVPRMESNFTDTNPALIATMSNGLGLRPCQQRRTLWPIRLNS